MSDRRECIADAWLAGGWNSNPSIPVEKPSYDRVAWVREHKPFTLAHAYRVADFVMSLSKDEV